MPGPDTVNVPAAVPVTATVSDLAAELARTDLQPGPRVDALFRALVAAAVAMVPDDVTLDDCALVDAVQRLCAQGETHLESRWADLVAADPARLGDFPYLENYRALVGFEHRAVTGRLGHRPRSVAVVGSGPLPLSAVMLAALDPALEVTCLDRDGEALARGERVVSTLGSTGVRHVQADARDHDYARYDAVVVAALVGLTPAEKAAVLDAVATTTSPRGVMAARSVPADGRRLLYPRIDAACMPGTVELLDEHHPPPGVINSLVLLRPS